MAVNKVVLGDETLVDLTNDTATEADVIQGKYFHRADGERVQGERDPNAGVDKPSQEKTLDITSNGTYVVTPDEGFALEKATVNVSVSGGVDLNVQYQLEDFSKVYIETEQPVSVGYGTKAHFGGVSDELDIALSVYNQYGYGGGVVGNKMCFMGGYNNNTMNRSILVFDTESETVTTSAATMGLSSYSDRIGASDGTLAYSTGGTYGGKYDPNLYAYDPETDSLSILSDQTPSLISAYHCAAVVDRMIYFLSIDGSRTWYTFDLDALVFATLPRQSTPNTDRYTRCLVNGNDIYLLPGDHSYASSIPRRYMAVYNVVSGTLRYIYTSTYRVGYRSVAVKYGNYAIVFPGGNSTGIYLFDFSIEEFIKVDATLSHTHSEPMAAQFGDKLYIAGTDKINTFVFRTEEIESNTVYIESRKSGSPVPLFSTDNYNILTPVDNVVRGNSDGKPEPVKYFASDGTNVVNMRTGDIYHNYSCVLSEVPNNGTSTTLSTTIKCRAGDLIVACIATRDTLEVSNGWTLISTSGINSADTTTGQRLSFAYKYAEGTEETITVTQASAQRLYINLVALTGATGVSDNGYYYHNQNAQLDVTLSSPGGCTLWACTEPVAGSATLWTASVGVLFQNEGKTPRLATLFTNPSETPVNFTVNASTTAIIGSLTIEGMTEFM